jgi:hypothetical protein
MILKQFTRQSIFGGILLAIVIFIVMIVPIHKSEQFLTNSILSGGLFVIIYGALSLEVLKQKTLNKAFLSIPKFQFLISALSTPVITFLIFTYLPVSVLVLSIVYAVIFFIFIFRYRRIDLATNLVQDVNNKVHKDTHFMKTSILKVNQIIADNPDATLKPHLLKLKEAFSYSNPKASKATQEVDQTIEEALRSLGKSKQSTDKNMDLVNLLIKKIQLRQDILKG